MIEKEKIKIHQKDVVIIGAGLTGLTTAFYLTRKNKNILLIEQQNRTGGQICTHNEKGFTFESGPNTGVISCPEVAELFADLNEFCQIEIAKESSKQRMIWKNDRFYALPSNLSNAIFTPLFSLKDKLRILGEPFRSKGNYPDETIGMLTKRRLGKSFLDYAVDPFISGIYAGNPMQLVTRFALPKLYQLEQNYGSFIKGSIVKARQPKNEREMLATKKIFSVKGGLNRLTEALEKGIGSTRIILGAHDIYISPENEHNWIIRFTDSSGEKHEIHCAKVITTTGGYTLAELLPFIDKKEIEPISKLYYAPVIQVSVGINHTEKEGVHNSFGGLVPSCEKKEILGILFPSACFTNRAPKNKALYSFFIGGVRHPDFLQKSDNEIKHLITESLRSMLNIPEASSPDIIRIFRHEKAIPQYDIYSQERIDCIEFLEKKYPGLILAGSIKGGIGMADRIRQAVEITTKL